MAVPLTVLNLAEIGVPPYSARVLSQSLAPITQATALRRTTSGKLRNLSPPQMRKYATTISGGDQLPPALDNVWPGDEILVDVATELAQQGTLVEPSTEATEETESTESGFGRTPVPGSIRYESGFTYYRPRFICMVVSFAINRDTWGAVVDWQLMLEEV